MALVELVAIIAVAERTAAAIVGRKANASAKGLTFGVVVAPHVDIAGIDAAGLAVVAVTGTRSAREADIWGINAHTFAQALAII
jgi:hypothetical protein